ncbi:MAG: hypothetical protein ACLSG5_02460 [Oscillospiraceae bacterium]
MKRFTSIFTAVAVALTLMMSVMPMTVFAAYKLTKNDGSAIPARIDVGESFNIKVDGAKVYFYSDNKEWRQSAKNGLLTAVGPGSVKIKGVNQSTEILLPQKPLTFVCVRQASRRLKVKYTLQT